MPGGSAFGPSSVPASPRSSVAPSPLGTAVAVTGEGDEKFQAYMKALRVGRLKDRAKRKEAGGATPGSAHSSAHSGPLPSARGPSLSTNSIASPVKGALLGVSVAKISKPPKTPGPVVGKRTSTLKSGKGLATPSSSAAVVPRSIEDGNPHGEPLVNEADSDSSDSIDFDVRSIGHVRIVKKGLSSAGATQQEAAVQRPLNLESEPVQEIRELQR
jgi:hypothetical protein